MGDETRFSPGLPGWFNRLAATLGLSLLAPFLVLVWLLVRLDSPGGALFLQPRIGRGGTTFTCYKFRSMRAEPAPEILRIRDFSAYVFSPMQVAKDPRVTRLGALLRCMSVDELPQLLNVVRGEMALVGPRPELPRIVAQYPVEFQRRHLVPPGISGLAQISGRSDLTYVQGVTYDLVYVDHRSARLDLEILRRTIAEVRRGSGAR